MRGLSVAFVSLLVSLPAIGAAPLRRVPDAIPNRYIVLLDAETRAAEHADVLARVANGRLVHRYDSAVNGFSMIAQEQGAQALAHRPGVLEVSEVGLARLDDVRTQVPDGLDRIDQRDLPLNDTYTYFHYTVPTTIYIVDSGVDPRPDFGTRLVRNINFSTTTSGVRNPDDYTDHGLPLNDVWHGTATAALAGGTLYGVAPFVKLANVRVCRSDGLCGYDDIVAAADWITAQKAAAPAQLHVANLSVSGPTSATLEAGLARSVSAGVAWIFSAANDAANACNYSPGRMGRQYSGVITVGAMDPRADRVYDYSNQGPCVEIFAPSEVEWGTAATTGGTIAGGTSAAAPHVAGVFASRWANSSASSAAEIEGLLKGIATPDHLTNLWSTSPNLLLHSLLPRRRPS